MTPTLDRYLNQWARYKIALVIFLAINMFSIILSLVLGIHYFTSKHNSLNKQSQAIASLEVADLALMKLNTLQIEFENRKVLSLRTVEDEKVVLQLLAHTLELNKLLQQLQINHSSNDNDDIAVLISSFKSGDKHFTMRAQIENIKQQLWLDIKSQLKNDSNTTQLLILTGLLTLIFGVILPTLVLYLMGRGVNHIRTEMQATALEFIKSWGVTRASFGDAAFSNVEFWLQILLLIGSTGGRFSAHPVIQVSSELAHIIRIELQKKPPIKPAA